MSHEATKSSQITYELFNRAVNLTKRLASTGENNGRKLCEYEPTTPELCSKSPILLQVLSDAAPDPGFAPKRRSQPPWVHISEKDKVSTEVTRADLLSSVRDTLKQNCVCGAWPFSWLSSCLWRTRRGKRGEGWRRHSKLGSLLFLRVLRQTQLAASHCNDYPATKSFHSAPKIEKKNTHISFIQMSYVIHHTGHCTPRCTYLFSCNIWTTTTYKHTCLRWCMYTLYVCNILKSVYVSHEAKRH